MEWRGGSKMGRMTVTGGWRQVGRDSAGLGILTLHRGE